MLELLLLKIGIIVLVEEMRDVTNKRQDRRGRYYSIGKFDSGITP